MAAAGRAWQGAINDRNNNLQQLPTTAASNLKLGILKMISTVLLAGLGVLLFVLLFR
jgi:hypothetical protein